MPGGSNNKDQFLSAKDVPPKGERDGAASDDSQREFAKSISGFTQVERNKMHNVIQIIKQVEKEKE